MARVLRELPKPVTIVSEPLIGSVGPLGVLSLAFVGQPEPNEPDLRFLSTLAGLTAQALERAQVFEHEREALRDAEAGRERLSLLSEVTRLLSSSLEPTIVIRRTMSLVEGRLADSCLVQVPGDSGLVRLDVREPGLASSRHAGPEGAGATCFRSGPMHRPRSPSAPAGPNWRHSMTVRGAASVSTALSVPLTANGEVIGVMTFVDGPGRIFEADDVSLATEVASRAGVALSNATRFQREHVVADVLQRAVLPDSLPEVEGLVLDAEYRAGVAGTYAGGDWYDVFELGDDSVFFSVGDVMGKGAPAAALMGQVRSAIRAYAVSGLSPTEVLSSLDHLFDTLIEDRVVTAVVGTITPSTGRRGPEQRRSPSPTGGAGRRQRDLLPHATDTAHCGGAERLAATTGRARSGPRRLADHVLGRPDRAAGRGHHARHGAAGRHGNSRCACGLARASRRHLRVHAERRGAHRRHRGALHQLHRFVRTGAYPPRLWVRHGMECQPCISNRSWRARRWLATGSRRTCAICPPR